MVSSRSEADDCDWSNSANFLEKVASAFHNVVGACSGIAGWLALDCGGYIDVGFGDFGCDEHVRKKLSSAWGPFGDFTYQHQT